MLLEELEQSLAVYLVRFGRDIVQGRLKDLPLWTTILFLSTVFTHDFERKSGIKSAVEGEDLLVVIQDRDVGLWFAQNLCSSLPE